jgi:hypothetical protein
MMDTDAMDGCHPFPSIARIITCTAAHSILSDYEPYSARLIARETSSAN